MAKRKNPKLRAALERALLKRDRAEISAAERLLSLLKIETPKTRKTKKKKRAR